MTGSCVASGVQDSKSNSKSGQVLVDRESHIPISMDGLWAVMEVNF